MLSTANIIQQNSGNTGTTSVGSWNMTLPNPVADGNAVVGAIARADGSLFIASHVPQTPSGAPGGNSIGGGGTPGEGEVVTFGHMPPNGSGFSSWNTAFTSGTTAVCWVIAEVSGLAIVSDFYPAEYTSLGWDHTIDHTGGNFVASTVNTGNTGTANKAGDTMVCAAAAHHVMSGAPPTFTSIADTTGGQPGTWGRIGAHEATSRIGGQTNIELDLFFKFTDGAQSVLDATFTYGSAGRQALSVIAGIRAFDVLAQQTRGRQATNSMT